LTTAEWDRGCLGENAVEGSSPTLFDQRLYALAAVVLEVKEALLSHIIYIVDELG